MRKMIRKALGIFIIPVVLMSAGVVGNLPGRTSMAASKLLPNGTWEHGYFSDFVITVSDNELVTYYTGTQYDSECGSLLNPSVITEIINHDNLEKKDSTYDENEWDAALLLPGKDREYNVFKYDSSTSRIIANSVNADSSSYYYYDTDDAW